MALNRETFERLADKALRKAGHTHLVEDVIDALQTGRMQALYNDGGMIITEITNFPNKRVCDVFLCVGELASIVALKPQLIEFGKHHAVELGRAHVRPGLVEPWKALGWKEAGTVMLYEMEN